MRPLCRRLAIPIELLWRTAQFCNCRDPSLGKEFSMGSQSASHIVTAPSLQSTVPTADTDAGSVPVFWIYVDDGGRWCLRKEGGAAEAAFDSRAAALAFVRDLARTSPSYRLFIETEDGRIIQEPHTATEGHAVPAAPEKPNARADAAGGDSLGRGLEWADQLTSAARVSPSRVSLLSDWLHKMRS
jgi:hypothetical protein